MNLSTGLATGGAGTDALSGIESVTGSHYNDTLAGDAGGNVLDGGDGNDAIDGGAGSDHLFGGNGADTINGGDGDDTIEGGAGADSLSGNAGHNTLSYAHDTTGVNVDLGAGTATGGDAAGDTFDGSTFSHLVGGLGNDTLFGNSGDSCIEGGGGNDNLFGGIGNDSIDGGAGNDSLSGIGGDDSLFGGAGQDSLLGGAGNDILFGGQGCDTLDGGGGNDIYRYTAASEFGDNIIHFHGGDKLHFDTTANDGSFATTLHFSAGAAPDNTAPSLYYDTAAQNLMYDADGTGVGGALTVAHFDNAPAHLDSSDVEIHLA
ncbi:MAG: hypothetical protein A2051_06375 [Desulfovibrionales bacterium GWA2_65_9]|nr:MAG: hypothetical protein A2051_06375 [Desulfovibrionales bacterium GWA2_65_9]